MVNNTMGLQDVAMDHVYCIYQTYNWEKTCLELINVNDYILNEGMQQDYAIK
jgi:hypothetical protein